jgi:hypothetical protein
MKLARQLGLNGIRFHDTRHSHASLLLKQGVHPKVVQEWLGYASISTTLDIYSHVLPGLQEAAAEKFDWLFDGDVSENSDRYVSKMLVTSAPNGSEGRGTRTPDTLSKSNADKLPIFRAFLKLESA